MDASLTLSLSHTNSETQDLIGSYFLDQWRLKSKSAAAKSESVAEAEKTQLMEVEESEDEKEELPTELDTLNSSGGFSIVGPDKLSVHYPNVNLHGHDVGVVQANRPAPCKRLVYYFEISVKNAGAKGQISIGFTSPGFKLRRQPGYFLVLVLNCSFMKLKLFNKIFLFFTCMVFLTFHFQFQL